MPARVAGPHHVIGASTLDRAAATASAPPTWAALAWRLGPYALIAVAALATRLRYGIFGFHDTFGSGDAHLLLTQALFVERGDFQPPASIGPPADIFANPPLIPLLLAAFSKIPGIALHDAPLILGPLLTVAALLALYTVVARAFDRTTALVGVGLVALLPRFAFDSTEPDKVAYVVSFFLLSLLCLYEGQRRPALLLAAGLFMGLSVFSHTTAYLFLPVYLLSHIALSHGSWRRMALPYFAASCAIVLAFLAAYSALNSRIDPAPAVGGQTSTSAPDNASGSIPLPSDLLQPPTSGAGQDFVPTSVASYWDHVSGLARDGFRGSAGDLYLDGIRSQILDPVYLLAIGGFLTATGWAAFKRRYEAIPLLLWMLLVTAGFGIQYPAASHTSRYPSYVTPVFVIMAAFFVVWAARQVIGRVGAEPAYAIVLIAPVAAFIAISYATSPQPGLRQLYEGHREVAEYVTDNGLLTDDAHLLYLGWPSYTYSLLEADPANADRVRAFGWLPITFGGYDAAFVEREHIRYYIYDDRTDDYYNSGGGMFAQLQKNFEMRVVHTFCTGGSADPESGCAGRVRLFELLPPAASTPP